MSPNTDPEARIVAVLEASGKPLGRAALRKESGLDSEAFESAMSRLRGQEIIRKLGDTDAFRLTRWPDNQHCAYCDESITNDEYYELELRTNVTATDSRFTGTMHPDCARTVLDELSLDTSD